eukprot:EG_transcript_4564
MAPAAALPLPGQPDPRYGTFPAADVSAPATPSTSSPAPPPRAARWGPGRPRLACLDATPLADLGRLWPLLAVVALVVVAILTEGWWQRPAAPARAPQRKEEPAQFTEAAVFVSRSLRWQEVSYGGCDEAKATACVMFNDSLQVSGWSELWVRAVPHEPSYASYRRSMFAAGYAEGAVTHRRIYEHYWNTLETFFPNRVVPPKLARFFADNLVWLRQEVAHRTTPKTSQSGPPPQYWQVVGGILAQFDGLVAGYQDFASPQEWLSEAELFLLNADGDLIDLVPAVNGTVRHKRHATQATQRSHMPYQEAVKSLRCSALIRLTSDRQDLLWGHTTWDEYSAMNRIFKHYDLPIPLDAVPSDSWARGATQRQVSFSSSPGYLTSADDWYLLDSRLAVMETTNGMYRPGLYALITPKSILAWMRAYAANVLASSATQWAQLFSMLNSGTYNNQWMVLDLAQFAPGVGLQEGGLIVVEQTPGLLEVADMTSIVNQRGYWASYNIPYFDSVYKRSGFQEMHLARKHDDSWSHNHCARARIFAERAPQVESLADLKKLLRYNDWRVDPLCRGHPSNGIAARYDLEKSRHLFALEGGIDTKVTSAMMAAQLETWAINGPTAQHNPVFAWPAVAPEVAVPHRGQPAVFNFSFVSVRPRAFHAAAAENTTSPGN